ncbi:MAG: hypothetical protein WCX64_02060 [Candidatus Micrarchaeia archaeon]
MYIPPADISKAIRTQATVVIDTSIFFDYLYGLSCLSDGADAEKQFEFRAFIKVIPQFKKQIITPHVLAEVCNIANSKFDEHGRKAFLTSILKHLLIVQESVVPKKDVLNSGHFCLLGATDVSCMLTAKESGFQRYLLIEDRVAKDLARAEGITVIDKGEILAYYLSLGGK